MDNNCKVDFSDFALFANDWLRNGNPFDEGFTESPEGMVVVPGGEFPYQYGTPDVCQVYVESFFIDKYEVTNELYWQFLNEADPNAEHWDEHMEINRSPDPPYFSVQEGKEKYPIRYANFYDANAFAQWKSNVEGTTYRLPTEEEWEKAAGWDPIEKHYYTYGYHQDGPNIDCNWCNYYNCNNDASLPVGSFNGTGGKHNAKSYYGCYDMSGNVWEWTIGLSGSYRVRRGGSYHDPIDNLRISVRYYCPPSEHLFYMGFRLVRELE